MTSTAPPDLLLAVIIIVAGVLVFILVFLMIRRSTRLRDIDPEMLDGAGIPSTTKRLSHRFSRRFSRRFSHLHPEPEHERDLSPRQLPSSKPHSVELNPMNREIGGRTEKAGKRDGLEGKKEFQRPHEDQGVKNLTAAANMVASIKDIETRSDWSGGTATENQTIVTSMNPVENKNGDM